MTFTKDILKESKSFAKFFAEKTNKDIYHHIEVALEGFHHLFVYFAQQGITICPIPDEIDDANSIISNHPVMNILSEKARKTGQVGQALDLIANKRIAASQIGNLIIVSDSAHPLIIQHELFHYVHQLLNSKTNQLIQDLYKEATKRNSFIDERIQEIPSNAIEEYFAHSGSAYINNKKTMWVLKSKHNKLKKIDISVFLLIQDIMKGDSKYFKGIESIFSRRKLARSA
jgi:hypothetical protein